MNAAPFKFTVAGMRWSSEKSAVVPQAARRERQDSGAGMKREPRKMPNGDPPPTTLWGTGPGE